MHFGAGFDVTTNCAAVIVRLVRLQKDIFSSDFNAAGQCEVHTSRSSEDMRAIPSDTARAIVWVLKEKRTREDATRVLFKTKGGLVEMLDSSLGLGPWSFP
jgi:hypothetical protein